MPTFHHGVIIPIMLRINDRVRIGRLHGVLRPAAVPGLVLINPHIPSDKVTEIKLDRGDVVEVEGYGKYRGYHLISA